MKKFMVVVAFGSILGGILFAWFSPNFISWYFAPPAEIAISCKPAVVWALEVYRKAIVAGVLIGAIVSGILFFAVRHVRLERAAEVPPPEMPKT